MAYLLWVFPLVNCPFCKTEITNSIREWSYSVYWVKVHLCPNCKNQFRSYYRNNIFSHTIPKFVGDKNKIVTYLKKHKAATEEELTKILKLDTKKIEEILLELEKEGIIENEL